MPDGLTCNLKHETGIINYLCSKLRKDIGARQGINPEIFFHINILLNIEAKIVSRWIPFVE